MPSAGSDPEHSCPAGIATLTVPWGTPAFCGVTVAVNVSTDSAPYVTEGFDSDSPVIEFPFTTVSELGGDGIDDAKLASSLYVAVTA
jgi:hypothetical protein